MSLFGELGSLVNAPVNEVRRFVLKHGMELLRDARRDPGVQARVNAALKAGNDHAAAKVYEDYYVKRVKEALEPWNWF
jgi:hypothetical protein